MPQTAVHIQNLSNDDKLTEKSDAIRQPRRFLFRVTEFRAQAGQFILQ